MRTVSDNNIPERSLTVFPENHDNALDHGKIFIRICKNCHKTILHGIQNGDLFIIVSFHGLNDVSNVDFMRYVTEV